MWRGPTALDACIATAAVPLCALRYGPAALGADLRMYGSTSASRKVAANAGVVADAGQLIALVEAARFLQVQPLLGACASAVESTLGEDGGVESAVGAWQLAESAPESMGPLGEAAYDLMARRFDELAASATWRGAPPALVRALLAEERLQVCGEEGVCSALLVWWHLPVWRHMPRAIMA